MRNVFVYKLKDNLWRIIDKSNGKVFEDINDVLLFNGIFKKYKGIKGWHGILSEEFNTGVQHCINYGLIKLDFVNKLYYPRTLLGIVVVKAAYVRLFNNNINVGDIGEELHYEDLVYYTKKYSKLDEDDDSEYDEEDYEDE